MGIPPTGSRVGIGAFALHRFSDGKISEDWANYDAPGMMRQLGVVPPPEQDAAPGRPISGCSEGVGAGMRAMDCECGRHLEAADDEGLFGRAREHVDRDHPEMGLGDEQVRGIVAEGAYDK